jgi:hypothetical protein
MYTHDPTFNPKGPHWNLVKEWCAEYGVSTKQIHFIRSEKKYCKESVDHVVHFMHHYGQQLSKAFILHDGGNSFKMDGRFIMVGRDNTVLCFPTETHGELSVLDNLANAIAKQVWRARRPADDMAKADLFLLRCIMDVKGDQIKDMWRKNLFLHRNTPGLKEVSDLLRGNPNPKCELLEYYVNSYEEWMSDNKKDVQRDVLEALESKLDGRYWGE